jgi:hypothetical protein|tara:strand:- start:496 stop:984 length:489 start_codon:yes stop_codon:yes gene_type:complete
MNFNRLVTDSKEGLKRNISSRRENISITIEEFGFISRKYFQNIKKQTNLIIEPEEKDKKKLIFILRWYYQLWIEIKQDFIEIYSVFHNEFQIVSEVNKLNHPHTTKTFKRGTKMYFNNSGYSSCNWLKGIPLWDNKDEEVVEGIKPSCQINYDFIKISVNLI